MLIWRLLIGNYNWIGIQSVQQSSDAWKSFCIITECGQKFTYVNGWCPQGWLHCCSTSMGRESKWCHWFHTLVSSPYLSFRLCSLNVLETLPNSCQMRSLHFKRNEWEKPDLNLFQKWSSPWYSNAIFFDGLNRSNWRSFPDENFNDLWLYSPTMYVLVNQNWCTRQPPKNCLDTTEAKFEQQWFQYALHGRFCWHDSTKFVPKLPYLARIDGSQCSERC